MKKYYLHNGKDQLGPFDIDELKNRDIWKNTPIWYEGILSWTTASKIDELRTCLTTTPPPYTRTIPVYSPEQVNASTKNKFVQRGAWILLSILVILLLIYFFEMAADNNGSLIPDRVSNTKANIMTLVTATRSDYKYRKIGGIQDLKITVSNSTDYVLENVKVKLNYLKPNGEVLNEKLIDFELLNPNSTSTIQIPNTNRGTSVEYEIVAIKSSALAMY